MDIRNYCLKICVLISLLSFSIDSIAQDKLIWVDDFDQYQDQSISEVWEGRSDKAYNEYLVKKEDEENGYLEAISQKSDMFVLKKIKVDLVKYPYLNWKWRVNECPVQGDESKKKYCDNPASIAIVLKLSKWRPKSIKYTWSATLNPNTKTCSPYACWPSRTDIIVLRSGKDEDVEWVTEKRNILQDYMDLYKKKNVKEKYVEAIVIMTDGDNTQSNSAADYDDIFFSKD